MTEAAMHYNIMRIERVLLRAEKGGVTHQEEADYGAEMDVYWQQMTAEEQQAVEDSDVGAGVPVELAMRDQTVKKGEHRRARVESEAA